MREAEKIKEAWTNKLKCEVGRRGGDNKKKKKILKRSMELRGSPAVRRDGSSSPTNMTRRRRRIDAEDYRFNKGERSGRTGR